MFALCRGSGAEATETATAARTRAVTAIAVPDAWAGSNSVAELVCHIFLLPWLRMVLMLMLMLLDEHNCERAAVFMLTSVALRVLALL